MGQWWVIVLIWDAGVCLSSFVNIAGNGENIRSLCKKLSISWINVTIKIGGGYRGD